MSSLVKELIIAHEANSSNKHKSNRIDLHHIPNNPLTFLTNPFFFPFLTKQNVPLRL